MAFNIEFDVDRLTVCSPGYDRATANAAQILFDSQWRGNRVIRRGYLTQISGQNTGGVSALYGRTFAAPPPIFITVAAQAAKPVNPALTDKINCVFGVSGTLYPNLGDPEFTFESLVDRIVFTWGKPNPKAHVFWTLLDWA